MWLLETCCGCDYAESVKGLAMESQGIRCTFLDATGSKSVRAIISLTVKVKQIIPSIVTKMCLPVTSPDGQPMVYVLDSKELGLRLREDQTLQEAGVKNEGHLIIVPEIIAG